MKKESPNTVKVPIVPPKLSREERKEILQESATKYLEAIETQIGDLKKVGKNALYIGGAILAAYTLTEFLLPSATKEEERAEEIESDDENSIVWTALKGVAVSLILAVAKDKLLEILENLNDPNAETNS